MNRTIQLTPRLRAAADWVTQGAVLCDVGTDHAHLPAVLLLEGKIARAIAADIRPGPLERAKETVNRYGLGDKVQLRLCPGLEKIAPHEVDTVTICGMGGEMICGILAAAEWTKEHTRLILQPQRSQEELRQWLVKNGYHITQERVVQEGKRWYTLLLAEGGSSQVEYTPAGWLAGHPAHWVREKSRLPYLNALLEKLEKLRDNMAQSVKLEDAQRRKELMKVLAELKQWKTDLEKGTLET
jgi:tRNA (adenine22-N1)-methyltransferase